MSAPSHPPRSRRWRRRLLWTGGLSAALLFGGVTVLRSQMFLDWAAASLETVLETTTGEDVLIGSLEIAPFQGRVWLNGLVVSHPGAPPGEGTVVAVDRIEVRTSLRDLWPRLESVAVERPVVHLHVDPDGLREFGALRDRLAASDRAPLEAFPWGRFTILEADFTLSTPNARVQVDGITVIQAGETASVAIEGGAVRAVTAAGSVIEQTIEPLRVPSIALTPNAVKVDDFSLVTTDAMLSGHVQRDPSGDLDGQLTLILDMDGLSPLLAFQQTLSGQGHLDVSIAGTAAQPQIQGALLVQQLKIHRPDRVMHFGDEIAGPFRLDGRQLLLEPVQTRWAEGMVEIHAAIDLATTGFQASLSAEDLNLEELFVLNEVALEPWVGMRTDLEGQLGGVLAPINAAGSVEIVGTGLEVAAGPLQTPGRDRLLEIPTLTAIGAVRFDRYAFAFLGRDVRTPRSRGAIDARIQFGETIDDIPSLDLDARFSRLDLEDLRPMAELRLEGRGPASLSIDGPFTALAVTSDVDLDDFAFVGLELADNIRGEVNSPDLQRLILPAAEATLGQTDYTGQLEITFGAEDTGIDLALQIPPGGRLEDLIGVGVDLDGVRGAVSGSMTLNGPATQMDGEIRLLTEDVNIYGEMFDDGDAVAWMRDGRFTLEHMELRRMRAGRTENLLARGSIGKGYAMNLEVLAGGMRLEQLNNIDGEQVPVRGDLFLDARIGGTLMEMEPRGDLALRNVRFANRPLGPSSLAFSTTDGEMSFNGLLAGEGLSIDGRLDLWEQQDYNVILHADEFAISPLYPKAPDGSPIQTRISGDAVIDGAISGEQPVHIDATVSQLDVDWRNHRLRSEGVWQYSQDGADFQLQNIALADVDRDTRIAFRGVGVRKGEVSMSGGGTVELDLMRMVVPGLTRADGVADVNVEISRGADDRVNPVIRATVDDALIRGDWFPHPIESMAVDITADRDGVDLNTVTGRVGGGTLDAGGRIDFDNWSPLRYEVSGQLSDARIRYLSFLPALTGDARLSLDGPADELLLSGDIVIKDMLFSERIDWESWILEVSGERLRDAVTEETADYFSMDIEITADDSIRMRNNVADMVAGGTLRLIGDTSRPGMTGSIRAQPGGRIYLKERNFELQRGELTFADPYAFDPDVDVSMLTDIRTREQDVRINYRVLGSYTDWYAQTSSDPAMSQADINALLLFGMTLEELERYGGLSSALIVESGDLLASKFGLVNRVGDSLFQSDLFRLDRVDLVSGVSERSFSSVTSELRLLAEKDLDFGATIRLEQNLNRVSDTFVSLEQRLARKLYLRGYWATEQQGRYIDIGGAYGVDVNFRLELD